MATPAPPEQHDRAVSSEAPTRAVPLEGATNFRDFGGYHGAGGGRVRWGHLYRSGHLSGLSDADRAAADKVLAALKPSLAQLTGRDEIATSAELKAWVKKEQKAARGL